MDGESFCTLLHSGRMSKGWTLERLGRAVGAVGPTVGRWEKGEFLPMRETALVLDKEFGYRGQLMRAWQTEKTGSPLPPWAHDMAELEQRAARIELVSPHVVPGLLQSPAYMELIMRRNFLSADRIKHVVDARARRYEVLAANGNPEITAVFPVTAITLVPDAVRREQVARLVELIDTERVEVHLIPQEDLLVGLMSPLMMFYLVKGGEIAASEHVRGAIIYADMEDYDRLHDRIKAALGRALPPAQSRRFLEGEMNK